MNIISNTADYLSIIPCELFTMILHFLDNSTTFSLYLTCKRYAYQKTIHTLLGEWLLEAKKALNIMPNAKIGSYTYMDIFPSNMKIIHNNAVYHGHIDLFKWLVPTNEVESTDALYTNTAAWYGRLDILKYLHENGCPWTGLACYFAAQYDHLEMLKYLHENGCQWDTHIYGIAGKKGHLEIVKYLYENDCPWDASTCKSAVTYGSLEIVKYLHTKFIEDSRPWSLWDCFRCKDAIVAGRLEILKYLHENGFPIDESSCNLAVANGHFEVFEWLRENGCPL